MTANTFGNTSIYIPNYRSSAAKSFSVDAVTENNATLAYQNIQAGLWNNSAAITSISISFLSGGNWAQGSSASLYGIRKFNTSAQPKATGGAISFDAVNNKWVHVFSTSGTFTPTANITCEYLVVAGGGGGQSFNSGVDWGRGGAGGFPTTSSSSFTSSANYTVTVGGGGAGGTGNAGSPGTAGSSSSLSGTGVSVTSSGGQGGNTTSSPNRSEFGGGNVNAGVNGYGGVGLTTTITGASIKYSGGGAKGILNSPRPSDDGSNYGGGLRLTNSATISNPVVANRAGGGSGGQNTGDGGFFAGEAGSSGLVVIRYDA
jgi:hypothetical protein